MARAQEKRDIRQRGAHGVPTGHVPAPRLQDIRAAIETVARLLERDERYLGLFLRLEDELRNAEHRQDALARARRYLPPTRPSG